MTREHRHLLGAFAAMIFVGASWGANLPVTKVMLRYYDLIPMAALRTAAATAVLALLLWLVEGRQAPRIVSTSPSRAVLMNCVVKARVTLSRRAVAVSLKVQAKPLAESSRVISTPPCNRPLALQSSDRTSSRISTKPGRQATTSWPMSPLKPRNA